MKKLLTLLLVVAMISTIACAALAEGYQVLNGFDPANFKSEKDPSEFKMAVVVKGVADWFSRLEEGVTEFAEKYGVDAHVEFPATTDAASQLEIIDQLKTRATTPSSAISWRRSRTGKPVGFSTFPTRGMSPSSTARSTAGSSSSTTVSSGIRM